MEILSKYENRNSSIELLRFFFMSLIVIIHAYAHGSGLNYDYLYSLGENLSTSYHLGLFSLGRCGVTGFIFISGYYGIKLKWKKIGLLITIFIFYIIVFAIIGQQGLGTIKLILHPWDSWWFVSSYIVICILSPLINEGIEKLTRSQFRNIVLFMLFYEYIGRFLSLDDSCDTVLFITIFLAARYTRIYLLPPPRISLKLKLTR